MSKIINFHHNPVTNIKKELLDKEKELEQAKQELEFFKRMYSQTASVSDLLKLEVSDLNSSITILEGHLKLIRENLGSLKKRLDQIDKQKAQVQVIENDRKDS